MGFQCASKLRGFGVQLNARTNKGGKQVADLAVLIVHPAITSEMSEKNDQPP